MVDEVYMGNVLQANSGQAPARQAAMAAGLTQGNLAQLIKYVLLV